ncbi:MAG: Bug family tripartite tricarboxylate transporter substrate binding protein [Burkholderiaceae bacterium]
MRIVVASVLAGGLALSWAGGIAHAQDAKLLRIIVPFQAGGQQDVIARHLAAELTPRLGATVIVENRPGASGMLAAEQLAKMPGDGSALMMTTGGAISIAPHLYPKLPYDPVKDFAPVAMIADIPMSVVVRSESPFKRLDDLVREAKARPGQITVANTGQGSISHLTTELFAQRAGIKLLPVPYKGVGAIQDLVGGQVDVLMVSAVSVEALVESRKVRVLGTFTTSRLPKVGDAPTVAEALGLQGLEFPVWVGLLAPAATPAATLARLGGELVAACNAPSTQQKFKDIISCRPGPAFGRVIDEDRVRWGETIRNAGIKAD